MSESAEIKDSRRRLDQASTVVATLSSLYLATPVEVGQTEPACVYDVMPTDGRQAIHGAMVSALEFIKRYFDGE